MEKKLMKVDERATEHMTKTQGVVRQVDTASGKVDNHDSKIKDLVS